MHHGFIAPTQYLKFIPKESKFHLILAHLLSDAAYVDFYRERAKQGDFIMMDNGAFEFGQSLPANQILSLLSRSGLRPNVIVSPDFPGEQGSKTLRALDPFLKDLEKDGYTASNIMMVPHSEKGNYIDWTNTYKQIGTLGVGFIGMSILALPTAFCSRTGTNDISLNRMYATHYLMQNQCVQTHVHHHYLGLGSNIRELVFLKDLPWVFSNDSSSAIWHGHLGVRYDESATALIGGKRHDPVLFDCEANLSRAADIEFNVQYIQQLLA